MVHFPQSGFFFEPNHSVVCGSSILNTIQPFKVLTGGFSDPTFLMGRQETTSSLMGDYGGCACSKKTNMKALGKSYLHQEV